MYLEHFQLKIKPFQITADPRFLWLGEKHKEALATLRYGILDNRGFLLLTGEVGTGKTILINKLVSMLEIDTVVATLPDPDLESMDFYNLLADGFQMKRTFDSKGAFLIRLRDFLHQSHAQQKQVLLIIDESQRLNHRLMEDIRVLSNIELYDKKLINIFFVGQQEFNSILLTPQNRALAQRITVRYHIEPLSQNETGNYIEHRLNVAGTKSKLFTNNAISEVYDFSNGIPRLINIICDHALLTAYAKGMNQIDEKIIQECAEELRIPFKYSENDQTVAEAPKVQNPSAIANAANKAGRKSDKSNHDGTETGNAVPLAQAEQSAQPSKAWSFAHIAMILALLTIVTFAVTHFTRQEKQRWNAEDLTPQKYKTTLEKEKALLADKLKEGQSGGGLPSKTAESTADHAGTAPADNGGPSNVEGPPSEQPVNNTAKNGISGQDKDKKVMGSETKNLPHPNGNTEKEKVGEIQPLPLIKENIIIHFQINSNEIDNNSYSILDNIAGHLILHSEETINIRGFTDSSGSPTYNENVSRFRASAVKSYLAGKGVDADRMTIYAMGDFGPIASNDSPEGRRLNRRVEIEFVPSNTKPVTNTSTKPPL